MNTFTNYHISIDKLADPAFDASGAASRKYLSGIENIGDGNYKYHYHHPNIFGRYCDYYFLVEGRTKEIIGWGFDYERSNPEVECGSSG
jgi:hypothetical protein